MQETHSSRKLLVCLAVQYGFPTDAVLPYILNEDKGIWEKLLSGLSFDIFICSKDGQICFLINNGEHKEDIEEALMNLPLVKEGFFEIRVYQIMGCKNLDSIFGERKWFKE